MRVEIQRSGVPEAFHEVAAVAMDIAGKTVFSSGEVGRVYFYRSSSKPFQAAVSQSLGAALPLEHLAVACGSHDGDPVHLAIVEAILASAGLDESYLRCPPDWPLGMAGKQRVWAAGARQPKRIWMNCSGKHSAMLKACVAQGWSLDDYLSPEHPLQKAIAEMMVEVTGELTLPTGTDGCGAPVFRTSTDSLAMAFRSLAEDERFSEVRTAMGRYPALVSGYGNDDALIATWLGGVAKRGAEGCMGVALPGRGAVAVKAWDGSSRAVAAAVYSVLDLVGWIPAASKTQLRSRLETDVLGGGRPVGLVRAVL